MMIVHSRRLALILLAALFCWHCAAGLETGRGTGDGAGSESYMIYGSATGSEGSISGDSAGGDGAGSGSYMIYGSATRSGGSISGDSARGDASVLASAQACQYQSPCAGKPETGTSWLLSAAPKLGFTVAESNGDSRDDVRLLQMEFESANGTATAKLRLWRRHGSSKSWAYMLAGPPGVDVNWVAIRLNGGVLSVNFHTSNFSQISSLIVHRETFATFDVTRPAHRSDNVPRHLYSETSSDFVSSQPSNSSCLDKTGSQQPSAPPHEVLTLEIYGWKSRSLRGSFSSVSAIRARDRSFSQYSLGTDKLAANLSQSTNSTCIQVCQFCFCVIELHLCSTRLIQNTADLRNITGLSMAYLLTQSSVAMCRRQIAHWAHARRTIME